MKAGIMAKVKRQKEKVKRTEVGGQKSEVSGRIYRLLTSDL